MPKLADVLGGGEDDGPDSKAPSVTALPPLVPAGSAVDLVDRALPGVRSFAFALEPLFASGQGEHAVCALPYALVVR